MYSESIHKKTTVTSNESDRNRRSQNKRQKMNIGDLYSFVTIRRRNYKSCDATGFDSLNQKTWHNFQLAE